MTGIADCAPLGERRSADADLSDRVHLDLAEPTHLIFHEYGREGLACGAGNGDRNCVSTRHTMVLPSQGLDEIDEAGGNGAPQLYDSGTTSVAICFRLGDEAPIRTHSW